MKYTRWVGLDSQWGGGSKGHLSTSSSCHTLLSPCCRYLHVGWANFCLLLLNFLTRLY